MSVVSDVFPFGLLLPRGCFLEGAVSLPEE